MSLILKQNVFSSKKHLANKRRIQILAKKFKHIHCSSSILYCKCAFSIFHGGFDFFKIIIRTFDLNRKYVTDFSQLIHKKKHCVRSLKYFYLLILKSSCGIYWYRLDINIPVLLKEKTCQLPTPFPPPPHPLPPNKLNMQMRWAAAL